MKKPYFWAHSFVIKVSDYKDFRPGKSKKVGGKAAQKQQNEKINSKTLLQEGKIYKPLQR